MIHRELINYQTIDGNAPFEDWLKKLRDRKGRSIILARLDMFEQAGHPGKTAGVGEGVHEIKIWFGPGYRIYYGEHGKMIVILLMGGDKRSQIKDIKKAKEYWADFKRRQG